MLGLKKLLNHTLAGLISNLAELVQPFIVWSYLSPMLSDENENSIFELLYLKLPTFWGNEMRHSFLQMKQIAGLVNNIFLQTVIQLMLYHYA